MRLVDNVQHLSLTLPTALDETQARSLWDTVEQSHITHLDLVLPEDTVSYGAFLPPSIHPMHVTMIFGTSNLAPTHWGPLLGSAQKAHITVRHNPENATAWWTTVCQQLGNLVRDHIHCPCILSLQAPKPHTTNDLASFAVRMAHALGGERLRALEGIELESADSVDATRLPLSEALLSEQAKWYDLGPEDLEHLGRVCSYIS